MPSSITTSYGIDPFHGADSSTAMFERKLHNSYDSLMITINNILEKALGFVFDANEHVESLLKIKDSDFSKKLECMKSSSKNKPMNVIIDRSDDGKMNLRKIVNLFYNESNVSNPFEMCIPEFSSRIVEINDSILNDIGFDQANEHVVTLQLGNCINDFPIDKDSPIGALNFMQYAFRVTPFINNDYGINRNYNTLKNVDIRNKVKYIVYVDIGRLLHLILTLYDPSNLPDKYKNDGEDKKRDSYIRTGMNIFRSIPELILRNIIAEVYTNHVSVRYGWKHFLKCREKISDKFMKSDGISMIIRKATHNYMSNNPNFEFDPNTGSILDLDNYGSIENYGHFTGYNPNMSMLYNVHHYVATTEFNIDSQETRENIEAFEKILFEKAFSNYFTTSAIWFLENIDFNGGMKLCHRSYSRSFYQRYDKQTLLGATETIDNYVLKDFYRTIISEVTPFNISKPYVQTIKETKENLFFYYCKLRKRIWLEFEIALRTMIRTSAFDRSNLSKAANETCIDYLIGIIRLVLYYDFAELSSYSLGYSTFYTPPNGHEDIIRQNVKLIFSMYRNLSHIEFCYTDKCHFADDEKIFDTYIEISDVSSKRRLVCDFIESLKRYNYIPSDI